MKNEGIFGKWKEVHVLKVRASLLYEIHNERILLGLLKARLHGRFLLRFKLRFSPFGGCEGVDYLMMLF